jgi:hypothetical protein
VADVLSGLANVYRAEGKYAEAEGLFKRALAIREEKLGKDHPRVALNFHRLAIMNEAQGNYGDALAWSRKASAAVIAHAQIEGTDAQQRGGAKGLVEKRADYFRNHVAILYAAGRQGIESEAALAREGFEIGQWAFQSSAAAALAQMAARLAKGEGALAQLVRDRQDLERQWHVADQRLNAAVARGDVNVASELRGQLSGLETKFAGIDARLAREVPDYVELSHPKPLSVTAAQALLGTDEALLFWLDNNKESYVFALTRDGFEWRAIGIGAENLSKMVAAFRDGLDLDKLQKSAGKPVLFDLALAHELYVALIGPVEELVKDKRHLLVVPSGPLTSLPFHLLVTEKPAKPVTQVKDIALYRDAAWLIKRQAVSVGVTPSAGAICFAWG